MHAYDSSSPAFVNNLYRSGTSYSANQQSYGFKAQEYPVALRFDSQPMAGVPYTPSSFSAFYPCAPTAHRYLHQFNCSYPSSISNGFIACRRPKRIRTAFTPTQLLHLESAFDKNHYIVGSERKQLASFLNLSETQIKVWFQNRRTKWKRQQVEDNRDLQLGSPSSQGQVKSEQEQMLQRFASSSPEQQNHEKNLTQ